MKLVRTGAEFKVHGVSQPGVPFLVDRHMEFVDAPNDFLLRVATVSGRTTSPKTWSTYAEHLYEYFSYLEANGFRWEEVNETHLAVWRDSMLRGDGRARGCSRRTVNDRLRSVARFYQWAFQQGRISGVPFASKELLAPKPKRFMAHVDASGNRVQANELTLPTYKPVPEFLPMKAARCFVQALSPCRARLIGYLMLASGLRREEAILLDERVAPDPRGFGSGQLLPMRLDPELTPTKGHKSRTVMVPYELAVRLFDYRISERPGLARRYRRRHGSETTALFLTQQGEVSSVKGIYTTFKRARRKTGIQCRPHLLRHTYATYELLRMMEKRGRDGALLWVRDRLGHSSVKTTEIYLHTADLIKDDAVDGYVADICSELRGEPLGR